MWDNLFLSMMHKLIRIGMLTVTMPSGETITVGEGNGPVVNVQLHEPSLPGKLIRNPELALGEAYMDETLTIENDDLRGLLTLLIKNNETGAQIWWQQLMTRLRHAQRFLDQHNPLHVSKYNVEKHYDLSVEFYDLFMEQDKQYTCAYFKSGQETLEQAQKQKKDHIAAKLLLKPGLKVMDIGCGWGGLAITLAKDHGVRVVGITLSETQRQAAEERAERAGVSDLVEFRLSDYRDVTEQFDRIVAVGMMEHVGRPQYRTFFRKIEQNLRDDGAALIHFIGRSSPPDTLSPWFQKYIFPGGYAPAMSEVLTAVEKEKLVMCDLEVWRTHYERTLQHWQRRFDGNIDKIRQLYDERFVRMWRYYLIASELSFSEMHQVLFQMQLAKKQDAVPVTRDYLYS